jgi:FtsP/CotA-like multicopper oxidase with cupredoxin domain
MKTRRQFFKIGAAVGVAGAGISVPLTAWRAFASVQTSQTPLLGANIPQFVDALPTFFGNRVTSTTPTVTALEFQQKILPGSVYANLTAPFNQGTYVWGYQVDGKPPFTPGFTIQAQRHTPMVVTYVNNLPLPGNSKLEPLMTIDQTVHWADPLNQMGSTSPYTGSIPMVVHLHGAEVASFFDGVPEAWFTRDGRHGKGYSTFSPTSANAAVYRYLNDQQATTLWFHDHSLGMTRINVFSGQLAFYLLRDQFDTGLPNNPLGLPAGNFEVELAIQDKQFDINGQLLFPDGTPTDNPTGLNGPPGNPGVHPFWIPEFFGDAMMANGKTWPFLNVEPRRYRFRVLDGCNARFLRMSVVDSATSAPGPTIWQIGTDGGLLDRPAVPNDPNNTSAGQLFLAPSERADIIIDFSKFAGRNLTLVNDAQAPFPSGGTDFDPAVQGRIMQFRVNLSLSSSDTTYNPASGAPLRGGTNQEPAIVRLASPTAGTLATGVRPNVKRQLVLVEVEGPGGPIEVLINNSKWKGIREGTTTPIPGAQLDKAGQGIWLTELPRMGATEEWEIINLTQDAHPIHIHLIQFQLINRQEADVAGYRGVYDSLFPGGLFAGLTPDGTWGLVQYAPGTYIPGYGPPNAYNTPNAAGALGGNPDFTPHLQGAVILPDSNEAGWKDTLKMFPGGFGAVTRLVIRWAPVDVAANGAQPGQSLFSFDPTTGPGYVWHCHILDHEDNEMMRPYAPTH